MKVNSIWYIYRQNKTWFALKDYTNDLQVARKKNMLVKKIRDLSLRM